MEVNTKRKVAKEVLFAVGVVVVALIISIAQSEVYRWDEGTQMTAFFTISGLIYLIRLIRWAVLTLRSDKETL